MQRFLMQAIWKLSHKLVGSVLSQQDKTTESYFYRNKKLKQLLVKRRNRRKEHAFIPLTSQTWSENSNS